MPSSASNESAAVGVDVGPTCPSVLVVRVPGAFVGVLNLPVAVAGYELSATNRSLRIATARQPTTAPQPAQRLLPQPLRSADARDERISSCVVRRAPARCGPGYLRDR